MGSSRINMSIYDLLRSKIIVCAVVDKSMNYEALDIVIDILNT